MSSKVLSLRKAPWLHVLSRANQVAGSRAIHALAVMATAMAITAIVIATANRVSAHLVNQIALLRLVVHVVKVVAQAVVTKVVIRVLAMLTEIAALLVTGNFCLQ